MSRQFAQAGSGNLTATELFPTRFSTRFVSACNFTYALLVVAHKLIDLLRELLRSPPVCWL